MDIENNICLTCEHFGEPDGFGCKAFPEGIPYGYPPNNKHEKILEEQIGDYVYIHTEEKKGLLFE